MGGRHPPGPRRRPRRRARPSSSRWSSSAAESAFSRASRARSSWSTSGATVAARDVHRLPGQATPRRLTRSRATVQDVATDEHALDIAGRSVTITSPDKVFFPERSDTKLDLVRYYLAVAEPFPAASGGRPALMQRLRGEGQVVLPETRPQGAFRTGCRRRSSARRTARPHARSSSTWRTWRGR